MNMLADLISGKKAFDTLTETPRMSQTPCDKAIQAEQNQKIEMVRLWLFRVGEPAKYHSIVLDKCERDPATMIYFLKHANGEFKP